MDTPTTMIHQLTEQHEEWMRQGLVTLHVPLDGPDEGRFVARGARGMTAAGRSPRLAIEALRRRGD